MRVSISRTFYFEASHQLPEYVGKCANLHGHTYELRVTVSGDTVDMDKSGIIIDFGTLKRIVNETVVEKYDHKHLNDYFKLPSAEMMVWVMYDDLRAAFHNEAPHVRLERVRLHEGAGGNFAEVNSLAEPV